MAGQPRYPNTNGPSMDLQPESSRPLLMYMGGGCCDLDEESPNVACD